MGTNYYLRPKGFNNLDQITADLYRSIDFARIDYIKSLNKMIENAKKISPLYFELLDLPDLEELNEIQVNVVYDYELPEVHLCKTSGGWIPLFESTKYYKNFKEFEDFYNNHKDVFDIYNEYDEYVNFSDLKEHVFEMKEKATESHLQYNNSLYNICNNEDNYWVDDLGIEWTNHQNWS